MKKHLIILLCLLGTLSATAQTDSLNISNVVKPDATTAITDMQINLHYAHHSFSAALPIAAVGLALLPLDSHVSNWVQTKMPGFEMVFDDYIQYAPWAAHVTMGLCGVKGVSKNRYQVLTADALAAVMMVSVVQGLKYSINRTRPNGHSVSFPSGHTAAAFTGATLLAHEYANRSIWIPIAGYTVATATGVMRVLNNRHYVSDVVVGAAIGILSAELAYWATDAIFKDKKLFKSHRNVTADYIIKNY